MDQKLSLPNGKPLPVLLLASKCDLPPAMENFDRLDSFAQEHGFVGWFQISSKEGTNCENAARFLLDKVLEHTDLFSIKKKVSVSEESTKPVPTDVSEMIRSGITES